MKTEWREVTEGGKAVVKVGKVIRNRPSKSRWRDTFAWLTNCCAVSFQLLW